MTTPLDQRLQEIQSHAHRAWVAAGILRAVLAAIDRPPAEAGPQVIEAVIIGRILCRSLHNWQAAYAAEPLVAHVFDARARYRVASDNCRSKSGKSVERFVHMSYVRACELGYQGQMDAWWKLLWFSPT